MNDLMDLCRLRMIITLDEIKRLGVRFWTVGAPHPEIADRFDGRTEWLRGTFSFSKRHDAAVDCRFINANDRSDQVEIGRVQLRFGHPRECDRIVGIEADHRVAVPIVDCRCQNRLCIGER
jgi:hypothetical protein